jgi:hypothetical protein
MSVFLYCHVCSCVPHMVYCFPCLCVASSVLKLLRTRPNLATFGTRPDQKVRKRNLWLTDMLNIANWGIHKKSCLLMFFVSYWTGKCHGESYFKGAWVLMYGILCINRFLHMMGLSRQVHCPGEFGGHWIPILGEHFTLYCITKSISTHRCKCWLIACVVRDTEYSYG